MTSTEEQIRAIRRIMGHDQKRTYLILGKTWAIKEHLRKWGCFWCSDSDAWKIEDIFGDDPFVRWATTQEGIRLKEIKK
jgi:hypothetical protein